MIQGRLLALLLTGSLLITCAADEPSATLPPEKAQASRPVLNKFIEAHCLDCHDTATKESGLVLDGLIAADIGKNSEAWEKVVRRLTARQMPPNDATRPKETEYEAAVSGLEIALDAAAAKHPNPGRTETFRRLNRTEYQNTIRDLLAVEVDVASLLPAGRVQPRF